MKIIQAAEGVEVVPLTISPAIPEPLPFPEVPLKTMEEEPRPWPHDGVVRSWAY
jgi:hypothetical protein